MIEDVEALFSVNREQLGFIPEEKGGDVAGQLIVIDHDRETGEELRIDCTRFGSGAYSIPISVEQLEFETDADFILAIETAGMFQRLVKHTYWRSANCILVSMGGVPTRACRRFIRRLADSKGIPVYVFVDGDPYGYSNIYRTLKVGSGNAAHMNEFFCVPASSVSRRHPPGHHRLRSADSPSQGCRHQAGQGRDQERSLRSTPQGLARRPDHPDQDGRACRATGAGQARPQLRHRRVSAAARWPTPTLFYPIDGLYPEMQKPTLDELIRLPESAAIRAFLDGENNAFLRQLMSAASILSAIFLIVGLSEERYRTVGIWLTLLLLVGGVFSIRTTRFYKRNVRHLLMALLIALLMAVVLSAPDSLARVMMAGIFLPIALIFCRLTTRQYLALGTVYLATAAWFALRPGGLEFPKDAVPALVGCASSTLIVVTLASRITRKKKNRFLIEWSRERDRFTEHSRMQGELNDARTIQLSMLPHEPPRLAWLDYSSISLPATEVGGDYFEYFQLSDSKLAVVIGDVAGHGVASGLVLSGVRSGLHLLRDELARPLAVLEKLNLMVRDTAPARMFVTLQIALIDRDNEMLTVANAAHPPVLLLRSSSDELFSLGTEGLPLGTRLDPGLDEQSHSIRTGDTLVFYTDGVPEICNLHSECFGEERLKDQVHRSAKKGASRQIRDDILNGVSNFKGDAAQEDDLTLLILRLR